MRIRLFTKYFILLFIFYSCSSTKKLTSLSQEIGELRPGVMLGYLTPAEIPNSLFLLPPPPEEGSVGYKLDQEKSEMFLALDEKRKEQAAKDNVLSFPEATDAFNIVLDLKITEETTPNLYIMLRRSLSDAGLSTYMAKSHYKRVRPFMVNNMPTCLPEEDMKFISQDGSYPSGHTAIGWSWALILTEIFPEKTNEIMDRGKEFGISRNVCNVHWFSDVEAGRMMGAATVARLHANPVFMADLEAAKDEVEKIRKQQQ